MAVVARYWLRDMVCMIVELYRILRMICLKGSFFQDECWPEDNEDHVLTAASLVDFPSSGLCSDSAWLAFITSTGFYV